MSAPANNGSTTTAYQPVLLRHPGRKQPVGLAEYRAGGGYDGLEKAVKQMTREQVIDEVKASGLRGRGGAGFPAGNKWSFVPKGPGAKYLCVNADESEPGTFKDREIMEIDPHLLLEGVAIASYAIGATLSFIYIRGEYTVAADRLDAAIEEAKQGGLLGKRLFGTDYELDILVYRGAGAYICGEETALLESLEGKRPMPRSRPPFPAVSGLYAKPTVINNVETIANVPHIIARGAAWYLTMGSAPNNTGPKILCLSGGVNRPGNYEIALGSITLRDLVYGEGYGQGMLRNRALKAILPAGVSAPLIPADKLDTKIDYDGIKDAGSMLGSASFIVLNEDVCIVKAALRMVEFFRHESCGKCTPCREGTMWLAKVLDRLEHGKGNAEDLELLLSLADRISGKVLCALGDFATSPVVATIKHFRAEYLAHVELGRCPKPEWC
jgi:NADH-quinone oxidoreductase subunit F